MRNIVITCFVLGLFSLALGCQNKDEKTMKSTTQQSSMGMDECSMCAGHQTAKADGTCPTCGMKLTKSSTK